MYHKFTTLGYECDLQSHCLFFFESGVETFDIDLKEQKVTVKGNVKPEDVFQTVSKSGKKTSYWEGEATAPAVSAPAEATPAAEAVPNTAAEAPAAEAAPEITPAKADAWSSHVML